jgi:hypothetical protein
VVIYKENMKEIPRRRRITVTSSLNEKETVQLGNRAVVRGVGAVPHTSFYRDFRRDF